MKKIFILFIYVVIVGILSSCGVENSTNRGAVFEKCLSKNTIGNCSKKALSNYPIIEISGKTIINKGDTLILDASNSFDNDGYIESCKWYKEDILVSSNCIFSNSIYSYKIGSFFIDVILRDNSGLTSKKKIEITIKEEKTPPIIEITGRTTIQEGENLKLSADKSYDLDGSIQSYKWYHNSELISDKWYMRMDRLEKGEMYITLEITDNDNLTTTQRIEIIIRKRPSKPNKRPRPPRQTK